MKHYNPKKLIPFALASIVLVAPMVALGATILGVTMCEGSSCTFNDLIKLANVIVNFLIYKVSIPLAALGFMYAGVRLVLNKNKESEWKQATETFTNIGKGFIIMLGSFVLIKFILYQFLDTEAGFTLFLLQ